MNIYLASVLAFHRTVNNVVFYAVYKPLNGLQCTAFNVVYRITGASGTYPVSAVYRTVKASSGACTVSAVYRVSPSGTCTVSAVYRTV